MIVLNVGRRLLFFDGCSEGPRVLTSRTVDIVSVLDGPKVSVDSVTSVFVVDRGKKCKICVTFGLCVVICFKIEINGDGIITFSK